MAVKYVQDEFEVTEEEADKIRRRGALFANVTRSRKSIQNVLISSYGMKRSKYSGVIHCEVTLDDLFK